MLNEFMKLGQVIEVRGQKIRIRVFENKNGPILLYQGDIIKNVSVGSFLKIPKGYMSIIGKIEGEHISELKGKNAMERFQKESDSIERIIDVSVLGVMEHGVFQKGIMEIPLVFSDAYILEEEELQRVFSFFENPANAISLGNIAEYKNYRLFVDAQLLFASHIGIFGNTGSGKSNTLTAIYNALFQQFRNAPRFQESRFLLFDYNGEYHHAFSAKTTVLHPSTRGVGGDRLLIPLSMLMELDFWDSVCSFSDPGILSFVERVLVIYREMITAKGESRESLCKLLRSRITNLFSYSYRNKKNATTLRNDLFELVELLLRKDATVLPDDDPHSQSNDFLKGEQAILDFLLAPLTKENVRADNPYILFSFALRYRELHETARQFSPERHIEPAVKLIEARLPYLERLFLPVEHFSPGIHIAVVSLSGVHTEWRRMVSLILCKAHFDWQKAFRRGSLHILLDEAHAVLRQDGLSNAQNDYTHIFTDIIKEGRKCAAFLTIASQRPSGLSETMLSQLHNYFIHRLANREDLNTIERAVVYLNDTNVALLPMLPEGACIFTGAASNFPVLVQVDAGRVACMRRSRTMNLVRFWNGEEE